jgi:hypothetical protein
MSTSTNATPGNVVDRVATTTIGLGVAAIIGVFTALGIQGDLLARMLRNEPTWVTVAFVLAIVGVVVGSVGAILARGRPQNWVTFVGVALLCLGALIAVGVGVAGVGVRDQPTINIKPLEITPISATDPTPAGVLVRVTASGSFLASGDRMLLRVSGFPDGANTQAVWNACSSTAGDYLKVEGGDVLAAGESGPSTTGTTSNTLTLRVSTKSYRYICSHAVLSPQPGKTADERWVTTLVDLKSIGPDTASSTGTK